jgi:hypothetical protein
MNNTRPQVTNDSDGKQVYCYDLHVNGVFGRNRKAKREMFKLAKHLDSTLTTEQALALAEVKLKEIKLKGSYSYSLTERIGRVKSDSGFEIYTTDLFGGSKTLSRGSGNGLKMSEVKWA